VIVVCGEALVDLVAEADVLRPLMGGGPFNTAVALGRLGVPVAFLGRLSTDRFGDRLAARLAESGVYPQLTLRGDEPTPLAVVHVGADGEADYRFYLEGTAERAITSDMLPALPAEAAALHLGTMSLATEPAASAFEGLALREAGRRLVMIDPNVRPAAVTDHPAYVARLERLLRRAHVVRLSEADAAWLFPGQPLDAVVAALLGRGARLVAVTRGAGPATAATPRLQVETAPPPVEVVDTVGAGDAFNAGLLAGLWECGRMSAEGVVGLARDDLAAAMRLAVTAAALTCARAGAVPPSRAEVEAAQGPVVVSATPTSA
jgi:fructokinase